MAKKEVAVVGVGLSKHVSKRRDVNIAEMVWEAVSACYEDAGLKPKDTDAFITGNMPAFEGVNLPEEWGAGHWGAYAKPLLRITTGGTTGGSVAHGGYYAVASGLYDIVMCERRAGVATGTGVGFGRLVDRDGHIHGLFAVRLREGLARVCRRPELFNKGVHVYLLGGAAPPRRRVALGFPSR